MYDPRHALGSNPNLLALHQVLIDGMERALRRRYLASACRDAGDHDGEYHLLMQAAGETRDADDCLALLSEALTSYHELTRIIQWPRPRTRTIEQMLAGKSIAEPYSDF